MVSKSEYLAQAEKEYNRKAKAEKLAEKLEKKLEGIRSMGYKVIILGSRVKIT